jgi:phospholipid/cholesterol/gamma-HCH transport system substrate-binding protein
MYRGAEVKVGLIALLGLAVLALFAFYLGGLRPRAATYEVCVVFDNAQGLVAGDQVRMAGVQIGEVKSVELDTLALKAKAYLSLHRTTTLYDTYRFQISTSGLIQERFVEVLPPTAGPEGRPLKSGQCVTGVTAPGISELIASGAEVLQNLNRTAELLRTTLSDEEIIGRVKKALDSLAAAAQEAGKLADATSEIARLTQPEMQTTLRNVNLASADVKAMTGELRQRVEEGDALDNLEELLRSARETSANLERITAEVEQLTGDAQVQADLRGALTDIREAAAAARRITADLEVASKEVRAAAPAIPRITQEVSKIAETSQQVRERLKPPEINARFDVTYSPEKSSIYSSGDLYVSTQPNRFVRLGIDDIGESSTATLQVGERKGDRILRYGLYRSRLGVGADLRLGKHGMLSLDLFDPNALRADAMAALPVVPGRSNLDLILGVRDVGDENLLLAGVRYRR